MDASVKKATGGENRAKETDVLITLVVPSCFLPGGSAVQWTWDDRVRRIDLRVNQLNKPQ